ncbi:MAG: YqgE/AlgH family protein [Acidobacteriota bacterium]|nr:YqgE/AlgH family protein [Acidobacteriota bacterium]
MTVACAGIETPVLLVATPQVNDPFFDHGVVLLLHHDEDGSFGFNLNRPTELAIQEILSGFKIPWEGDPSSPAYFGGPVQPQLGSVLFGSAPDAPLPDPRMTTTAAEVCPGLRMTQHVDDLALLAQRPPPGFRLYLGYAGWGAGQLIDEILRNDWLLVPVIDELVFSDEPQAIWARALEAAGVDPQTLPSWTQDQSQTESN